MRKCIKQIFLGDRFRNCRSYVCFKNSSAFPGKKSNGNNKNRPMNKYKICAGGVAGVLDEVNDSLKTYRRLLLQVTVLTGTYY